MNYDHISEGVRFHVQKLTEAGFQTTDSGDGSNFKSGMGGALPFRHVFGTLPIGADYSEAANQIQNLFPEAKVEISISPRESAVFMVFPDGDQESPIVQKPQIIVAALARHPKDPRLVIAQPREVFLKNGDTEIWWGLPRGKFEETDSSLVSCANRELEEETGCSLTKGEVLWEHTREFLPEEHPFAHSRYFLKFFVIGIASEESTPKLPAQWISITDLLKKDLMPQLEQVLRQYKGKNLHFSCKKCNGSGKIYDPDDPPDIIEGNKLRRIIRCPG